MNTAYTPRTATLNAEMFIVLTGQHILHPDDMLFIDDAAKLQEDLRPYQPWFPTRLADERLYEGVTA